MEQPNNSQLKKQSVVLILFLIIVTFGLYYPIWFFIKRKELNILESTKKISTWSSGTLFVISGISLLSWLVVVLPEPFTKVFAGLFLFSIIFDFVTPIWILVFSFRTRSILKDLIKSRNISDVRISGFLTFLFSVIYLQYKINEIVEKRQLT